MTNDKLTGDLQVKRAPDGKAWLLVNAAGEVLATCAINAEAWRAHDRHQREAISRAEDMWDRLSGIER